jgi:hypothetical protein
MKKNNIELIIRLALVVLLLVVNIYSFQKGLGYVSFFAAFFIGLLTKKYLAISKWKTKENETTKTK